MKINLLLNNPWLKEEITEYIRKYFEQNLDENATYQNLGNAAEVLNLGKFIASNVYVRKEE